MFSFIYILFIQCYSVRLNNFQWLFIHIINIRYWKRTTWQSFSHQTTRFSVHVSWSLFIFFPVHTRKPCAREAAKRTFFSPPIFNLKKNIFLKLFFLCWQPPTPSPSPLVDCPLKKNNFFSGFPYYDESFSVVGTLCFASPPPRSIPHTHRSVLKR